MAAAKGLRSIRESALRLIEQRDGSVVALGLLGTLACCAALVYVAAWRAACSAEAARFDGQRKRPRITFNRA